MHKQNLSPAMMAAMEKGKVSPDWRENFAPAIARHIEGSDAYAPPGWISPGRPLLEPWRKRTCRRKGHVQNKAESLVERVLRHMAAAKRAETARDKQAVRDLNYESVAAFAREALGK